MFDRVLPTYYFRSQILGVEIARLLYLSFVETVGIEELAGPAYIMVRSHKKKAETGIEVQKLLHTIVT